MIPANRFRASPSTGLARQRISGGSGYANFSTGWVKLTGWVSDATYPAVISDSSLLVAGDGSVSVSITAESSGGVDWQFRKNNTAMIAWTSWNASRVWTGSVQAGDALSLWISALAASTSQGVIDLSPV